MRPTAVPADFPQPDALGAVPGAHPKLLVRQEAGRFVAGAGESELRARYEMCEDLASQLVQYIARKRAEHPDWSRDQLQVRVAAGLKAKALGWGLSQAEVGWVLQRVAALTGGPAGGATS